MKKICLLFFVLLSASLTSAQSSIIPVSEMVKLYKARNFQSASTTLERYGFKYQGYEPLRGGDSRRTFSKNCILEDAALSIIGWGPIILALLCAVTMIIITMSCQTSLKKYIIKLI